MTLKIRRLRPGEDTHLYDLAYCWLEHGATWRKDIEAVFGTLDYDDYMTATFDPGRVDVGVFVDSQLIALVIFTLRGKNVYEVHLEADRRADPNVVIEAGKLIRDQIFYCHGAELVYAWVPRQNRPVRAILEAIGFCSDHVTMLHGTCRGRLVEWLQLSIRANYDQQEANTDSEPNAVSEPVVQQHEYLRLDDAA